MSAICFVHAHPDDEAILTGGLILHAKEGGQRVVIVTCTGGEEGEIHNLDQGLRPRLGAVREEELRHACAILGVDRLALLGYRDSGMAGSPSNDHEQSFHRAPLPEAAERLAAVLREERPEVVVTYTPDGTYGHPDHIKAHQVTTTTLDRLRAEGWAPATVLWHAIPRSRAQATIGWRHPAMSHVGFPDAAITTEVGVNGQMERKLAAVAAHVSQNPPDLMRSMTGQVLAAMGDSEHYVEVEADVPHTGGGTGCENAR